MSAYILLQNGQHRPVLFQDPRSSTFATFATATVGSQSSKLLFLTHAKTVSRIAADEDDFGVGKK
jgi:hypothetical protein